MRFRRIKNRSKDDDMKRSKRFLPKSKGNDKKKEKGLKRDVNVE